MDADNFELCSFIPGDYSGGKWNMLRLKNTGNAASKIAGYLSVYPLFIGRFLSKTSFCMVKFVGVLKMILIDKTDLLPSSNVQLSDFSERKLIIHTGYELHVFFYNPCKCWISCIASLRI